MTIKFRTVKGKCSAKAEGMLTIYTALESMDKLFKPLEKSSEITFDMSGVTEFDTAGLQLLMALKKETQALEIAFQIKNPSEYVQSVFDKYCMTEHLVAENILQLSA